MARRTHQVVLYTHLVSWEPLRVKGSQGYAWIKTLAKDDETGAKTALVKYDPGFRAEASQSIWPADIYTLEGSMRCGDRAYTKDTYHYRPAGTAIGPVESKEGITRLIFTADTADPARSSSEEVFIQNVESDVPPDPPTLRAAPQSTLYNRGHIAPDLSTMRSTEPGVGESDTDRPTMRWFKMLRIDPVAEIAFRVQRVLSPGVKGSPDEIHTHPWTEECYMLDGENQDYSGDIDGHWRWIPGTYVCRVPNEGPHGDSLKFDDRYTLIVRQGWTADPEKAAVWKAQQDRTAVPVPGPVTFDE